jgi:hypothetical protein
LIRISLALVLLCGILANSAGSFDAPGSHEQPAILAPPEHRRGEEQTFLTFPEWFLVFSPAEYAQFVREHTPDEFVFWGHIHQFWQGYAAVARQSHARGNPPNWGYHLMIVVIGTSTTVEYVARSAYETIVGRLSALTARRLTPEDRYAARVAQEYVDFIRYKPWYKFDFAGRLRGLWTDTDLFGRDFIRKWERKYALTTEYGVKAVYGWLIGLATGSIYEAPREVTSVAVNQWPACSVDISGVAILRRTDDGGALLTVPRYEGFSAPVVGLAGCGADFQEIAGNRTVILVSTLERTGSSVLAKSLVLLRQPVLTRPGRERVVYVIPVAALAQSLRAFEAAGSSVELEHIFDY